MRVRSSRGFTLLEVLIALTVLAVGAALSLSVISGVLANIRKVQMRTKVMEHAETVMELVLLDDKVRGPTTLGGDFEDGTRWTVVVSDYEMPEAAPLDTQPLPPMPIKLLAYTVEVFAPRSSAPDLRLNTLKVVPDENQGIQLLRR